MPNGQIALLGGVMRPRYIIFQNYLLPALLFWQRYGGDPESGIVDYQWAIQRGSDTTDLEWLSVGMNRRVKTHVELAAGYTHYVKVKAINGVGLFRIGTSEDIRIIMEMRIEAPGP